MTMRSITTTTTTIMNTKSTITTSTKNMITTMNPTAISTTIITTTTAAVPAGHDHDADEIFEKLGCRKRLGSTTEEEVTGALAGLDEGEKYGIVLRAKGIVPCTDGSWIHFDYVPGEQNIRRGPAGITGRLCVIGSELKEHDLDHLFCLD